MLEYVDSSLLMYNSSRSQYASQTMGKVYFDTFQSLRLTNRVIKALQKIRGFHSCRMNSG